MKQVQSVEVGIHPGKELTPFSSFSPPRKSLSPDTPERIHHTNYRVRNRYRYLPVCR
jgi:hypothetical protein